MRRGEIYWADLPSPAGRRPILVLTRSSAIPHLTHVTIAELTTRIRDIPSEVPLGTAEGMPKPCVATLDNIRTISKTRLDTQPAGRLADRRIPELDSALCFALGVRR